MNGSLGSATRAAPAPAIPMRDYTIDGWLVQPALNRLVKGATAIRVRPQLIDLLGYLATRPGTVVSKDQLLAVVWSDRFVSASGVARCVAELRQVLADDARQPRIIETISKRGYRLIARVEPAEDPGDARRSVGQTGTTDPTGGESASASDGKVSADAARDGTSRGDGAWWRHLASAARSLMTVEAIVQFVRHGSWPPLR